MAKLGFAGGGGLAERRIRQNTVSHKVNKCAGSAEVVSRIVHSN